jgi:hypothetical protein
MVNHLMRRMTAEPVKDHRVRIILLSGNPEIVGNVTLRAGEKTGAWTGWDMAKRLVESGKFEIVEYSQDLVDDIAVPACAEFDSFDDSRGAEIPAFRCPECGKPFVTWVAVTGHLGLHLSPKHGKRGKEAKNKKGGRPKGTTKAVMERRRRRAALKAERERKANAESVQEGTKVGNTGKDAGGNANGNTKNPEQAEGEIKRQAIDECKRSDAGHRQAGSGAQRRNQS